MVDQVKLTTVEEFEQFIALPENRDRLFELIDGEIVEKVPTEEHSAIVVNIIFALRSFIQPGKLGRVLTEVRRQLPGDEHNAVLPDVEFTRTARLAPLVTEGAAPHFPDLAIEVKSPDDRLPAMRRKALYYLENGVSLVWLVYPDTRRVEVWTNENFRTIGIDDELDGGDVLPGFIMPVRDVFADQ